MTKIQAKIKEAYEAKKLEKAAYKDYAHARSVYDTVPSLENYTKLVQQEAIWTRLFSNANNLHLEVLDTPEVLVDSEVDNDAEGDK